MMQATLSGKTKQQHREPCGELPAELTQARRFGKTRLAQSTALLEDYVELIADLLANTGEARPTDIARRLGRFPCHRDQDHLPPEAGRAGNGPPVSGRFSDGKRRKASGASTNPS